MRKTTKELVILLAVFIIYFGYSAWIDNAALYHVTAISDGMGHWFNAVYNGTDTTILAQYHMAVAKVNLVMGLGTGTFDPSLAYVNYIGAFISKANAPLMDSSLIQHGGVMANDSLLYAVLTPFKLVLVGGVFGLLVPLTKSLFFGTIIGIKGYVKARRTNVLYNYQAAIAFVQSLKTTLETGDYEQIKAKYAAYSGLAFKPAFLNTMMDGIGDSLIRQQDMSIYIKPSDVVMKSIKQMYEKERKLAISQRPDEMFFDIKRGYEYTSIGSKYSIAYFKSLDTGADTQNKLGWKLFTLEMYKFIVAMIGAIIPTIIIAVIVLPILGTHTSAAGKATPAIIFGIWMLFSIIIHAFMVFSKTQYRVMWKSMVVPAVCYYVVMALIAVSFVLGLNALIALGSMVAPATSTKMWPWFSALANMVLTTTLMMYVMSTLMDGITSPLGLTNKLVVDGIVIPAVAWIAVMILNLIGSMAPSVVGDPNTANIAGVHISRGLLNGVATAIIVGTWIYLFISQLLLNNLVIPSRKRKMALQAELADQGVKALDAQKAADAKRTSSTK